MGTGDGELAARLRANCTAHFEKEGAIEGVVRLSGGASQETWRFDFVTTDGARTPLILRKDAALENPGNDRRTEHALMQLVARHGVKVPRQRFFLELEGGLTGFVMDRVDGETIPRKILRDAPFAAARRVLTAQCGEALARIHAVPLAELPALSRPAEGRPLAVACIEEQQDRLDALGDPHPVFELALRWLRANLPTDRPLALVHGDFRNGNLIVDGTGLAAVLDWELAHLGDPMEDLGWLCVKSWRFGEAPEVGGFGPRAALFEAYERQCGVSANPADVRFWEVFGTLKWGLICKLQADYHLRGIKRSVELAALGRRVCETESDLLLLLG